MLDEPENEAVILENLEPVANNKHPHHFREVLCKPGIEAIVMEPMHGYDVRERYVRTADIDELGRAIFRMETTG